MGDSVTIADGQALNLRVRLPVAASVRLLRNGQVVSQGFASSLAYQAWDAGVYRVEVWKERWGKSRGWIFSNPIYVRRNG